MWDERVVIKYQCLTDLLGPVMRAAASLAFVLQL